MGDSHLGLGWTVVTDSRSLRSSFPVGRVWFCFAKLARVAWIPPRRLAVCVRCVAVPSPAFTLHTLPRTGEPDHCHHLQRLLLETAVKIRDVPLQLCFGEGRTDVLLVLLNDERAGREFLTKSTLIHSSSSSIKAIISFEESFVRCSLLICTSNREWKSVQSLYQILITSYFGL